MRGKKRRRNNKSHIYELTLKTDPRISSQSLLPFPFLLVLLFVSFFPTGTPCAVISRPVRLPTYMYLYIYIYVHTI